MNKDELTTQLLAAKQMGTGGFIWFLDPSRSTVNSSSQQQNPRDGPLPAGDGRTDGAATDDTRPASEPKQLARPNAETDEQASKQTGSVSTARQLIPPRPRGPRYLGIPVHGSSPHGANHGTAARSAGYNGGTALSTTDMGVCSRWCGGEGKGDAGIGVLVSSWIACFLFPPCLDGLLGGFHRPTILSPPSHAGQATVSS